MKVLTLFSGTHSVSKALEMFPDAEEVTLDAYQPADIQEDVLTWDHTIFAPQSFDIVWASPCCTHYSRARSKAKTPRNFELADAMVIRALQIIDYLKPKVWFIENPQTGYLKHRNFMLLRPYFTVDYCMYDGLLRKRTAIWSNINLELHTCTDKNRCALFIHGRHAIYLQDLEGGPSRGAMPTPLLESMFCQAMMHIEHACQKQT